MKTRSFFRFSALSAAVFALTLLAGLLCSSPVAAQDAPKKAEQKTDKKAEPSKVEEKVQTGTIASTGRFGGGVTGLDISTDGATPGDDQNVISASVSQIGRGECQATITNTSNVNSYSVSFKVVGRNERGSKLVDKSYSASLKPQQKVTRQMDCPAEANMEVVLQSARKTNK